MLITKKTYLKTSIQCFFFCLGNMLCFYDYLKFLSSQLRHKIFSLYIQSENIRNM